MKQEEEKMKLTDGFITHNADGEQVMVAVGDMTTKFAGLVRNNKTAAFIVDCLKEETTKDAIVDKILEKYEVDRETADRDVSAVIEKLKSIGAVYGN